MKVYIVFHTYEYGHNMDVFDTEEKAKKCLRETLDEYGKEYERTFEDGLELLEASQNCNVELVTEEVQ